MTVERTVAALAGMWLAGILLVALAHCAEPVPMPPGKLAGVKYGCTIQSVANEQTVSVKDLKKPKRCWIVNVWAEGWKGAVIASRDTDKAAWKECSKWRARIDAEAIKQQRAELAQ